ncbi:MAG: phage minor head protein, partial [Spirochaetota bacterium]
IRSWLKRHAAENVKTILDTQKESMGKLIAKGVGDNLSTTEIAKSIRVFYDGNARYLAARVARSEVATASGYGSIAAAEQSGVADKKLWLTSRDPRVRDSHSAIDGETVAMDENFSNGLEYPGDQRGDPAESINCRCVLTFHSKE